MSRTERLLDLMMLLRSRKYAVTAAQLAHELEVSVRSVYRDISTLRAQGFPVEAEPGIGFTLHSDYAVPALMFTVEELDAILLGARWVDAKTDAHLGRAARTAMAKIKSVIPARLRAEFGSSSLWIIGKSDEPEEMAVLTGVRRAIRTGNKMRVQYCDAKGQMSTRVVWPFALGFLDSTQVIAAWCELRTGFRAFRVDRVRQWKTLKASFPRTRESLLEQWQAMRNRYPDIIEL